MKDTEMEQIIDSIVDSLFSVFVTLGMYFFFSSYLKNMRKMHILKLMFLI